jgi:uncharacterized membrane protein
MIKTNITYGLIVLVPVAIVLLLLAKIVEILEAVGEPLGLKSLVSSALAIALGLLFLLALCYVVGALVRSQAGLLSFASIENKLLSKMPGYEVVGNVLKGFAEDQESLLPVLLNRYGAGTSVFGLIMEENDDGRLTVFVPASPALTVGVVHVVDPDRVERLAAGVADVTGCVSQWGIGSNKVLGKAAG